MTPIRRRKNYLLSFLCAGLGLMSVIGVNSSVVAQDFTLFEEVDAANSPDVSRPRPSRVTQVQSAIPEFSLGGKSQIGDTRKILLLHRSGEKIMVELNASGNTPVPNYEEFSITGTGAREVALQYPSSIPCQESTEQGVTCNSASNIATLRLKTGSPVAAKVASIAASDSTGTAEVQLSENPENPFAIMRARQLQQANQPVADPDTQSGRFVPRRIDPSEVPPGSRIVSTPFGDRIVQQ